MLRKISARRRQDFSGPRRAIPAIARQKRELKTLLERERQLIDSMMSDGLIRAAFLRGHGEPIEPFSVWHDNDHSSNHTELSPSWLPKWDQLSEAIKMFAAFDTGQELQCCYSFTAHIAPDLITRWTSGRRDLMANVQQALRRALHKLNIADSEFCYVVETRSRSGRSKTRPHLHGFVLADDPRDASRFRTAIELALNPTLLKHGRKREIEVKRAYDPRDEIGGRARWVSYILKNVQRYDPVLGKRRVFMSQELTKTAREAWSLRRYPASEPSPAGPVTQVRSMSQSLALLVE
ncbi:hypothetical protein Q4F19_16210 [Sphingomonas sp. BIUV-7]|uniref:Replication initiation protein n=2 Tax=Sphingomonas natans TaxID=3063330 RepID=A0ABT8YEC7_9SPHN|nr:hypothetical protein [Sphingomonas sp. BIUV-7]